MTARWRLYERCGFAETDDHPEVPYAKADHRMVLVLPEPDGADGPKRVDELVIPVLRVADAAARWAGTRASAS